MKLHVTPSNFFSRIIRSEALVYHSFFFFFRTAVLRKLFDYKHCNFSLGCRFVKMASKTVTRSILASAWKSILGDRGADIGSKGKSKRMQKKTKQNKMARRNSTFFSLLDFPLPLLSAPGSPRMLGRERVRWDEGQGGKKLSLSFHFQSFPAPF